MMECVDLVEITKEHVLLANQFWWYKMLHRSLVHHVEVSLETQATKLVTMGTV